MRLNQIRRKPVVKDKSLRVVKSTRYKHKSFLKTSEINWCSAFNPHQRRKAQSCGAKKFIRHAIGIKVFRMEERSTNIMLLWPKNHRPNELFLGHSAVILLAINGPKLKIVSNVADETIYSFRKLDIQHRNSLVSVWLPYACVAVCTYFQWDQHRIIVCVCFFLKTK